MSHNTVFTLSLMVYPIFDTLVATGRDFEENNI